ncbi:hypothetical protein fugu_015960 [Takifugu bimaculatus]|uniref:Uncharacterized protein n=1 Tax=Takifugu bimaculatus TaxID=433685 RepID=A0A4Z2BW09_9TELE|nr:hypothetical protein fugu_015960 [Takifugu bimaculatus]
MAEDNELEKYVPTVPCFGSKTCARKARVPAARRNTPLRPVDDPAASRRRSRSNSLDRKRDRSRSPFRDHTSKGGNTDHKHHQRDSCNNKDKRRDGDRERSYRHKDNREWRHGRDKAKD